MNTRTIALAGFTTALLLAALPALAGPAIAPPGAQVLVRPDIQAVTDKVMPPIPSPGADEAVPNPDDADAPAAPAAPDAQPATPDVANEPIPEVEYDFSKLPAPVKRLRDQLKEAAATGDITKLKPIIEANGEPPQFSFNDIGDPIEYLKSLSGDPDGREILAILTEVLDAGYVHADADTPDEMYIWPYFARYPVDKLTPPQLVELFKLIYAGDYEDMKNDGNYLFYRVGITPKGVWKYFISGD
jgi:hypothetical protein